MSKLSKMLTTASALAVIFSASISFANTVDEKESITVYKSETCGCCARWIEIMERSGFDVKVVNSDDMQSVKSQLNVPSDSQSCHTAVTEGGYLVEGHVPPEVVKAMIENKPDIAGVAVSGMPIGSPGMEMPGMQGDAYPLLTIGKDGSTSLLVEIQP